MQILISPSCPKVWISLIPGTVTTLNHTKENLCYSQYGPHAECCTRLLVPLFLNSMRDKFTTINISTSSEIQI